MLNQIKDNFLEEQYQLYLIDLDIDASELSPAKETEIKQAFVHGYDMANTDIIRVLRNAPQRFLDVRKQCQAHIKARTKEAGRENATTILSKIESEIQVREDLGQVRKNIMISVHDFFKFIDCLSEVEQGVFQATGVGRKLGDSVCFSWRGYNFWVNSDIELGQVITF